MLSWISAHLGTIIISLVLLGIVLVIIKSIRKDKQSGKSSCGSNCSHCAMGDSCHKN